MKLTIDQIKNICIGAVSVCETEDGFVFRKITEKQRKRLYEINDVFGGRGDATTGVRIDVITNSSYVEFCASHGNKFDIYVNDVFKTKISMEEVRRNKTSARVELPSSVKEDKKVRLTVFFPSHSNGVLRYFELEDGASMERPAYDRKILFIGDSITQGWNSICDSNSYALRLTRMLNADSIVNGVGGLYYDEAYADSVPFDPDTVFIAYGTNDFSFGHVNEVLKKDLCPFLDFIKEEYADKGKSVYVITPIARGDFKTEEKNAEFDRHRETIAKEASLRSLSVIDGYSLITYDKDRYADVIHPNDLGFADMAEAIMRLIK